MNLKQNEYSMQIILEDTFDRKTDKHIRKRLESIQKAHPVYVLYADDDSNSKSVSLDESTEKMAT